MRDVVVAFVAVAVAVAVVTMCLCWLLLLSRLTLVQSRHLPTPLSLPSTVTTTNSHQTRLFLPYNQRGQREKFARFMHAWSTRVCVCVCVRLRVWVCLSLALSVPPTPTPSPFSSPIPIAFQSPQLCVLPAPLFGISTGESPKTRRLFILLARKFYVMPPPPTPRLYLLYHPWYCCFCRFFISAFIVYRIVFHVYFINNFSNTPNTDTPMENEIHEGVEESDVGWSEREIFRHKIV